MHLRLGQEPVVLPEPLAGLVLHLAATRQGHATTGDQGTSPWLLPGGRPGQPISPCQLGERLRQIGIRPGPARSTALFQLATELPAAILARMLGIHIDVAVAWQRVSAGDWMTYAGRRQPQGKPARSCSVTSRNAGPGMNPAGRCPACGSLLPGRDRQRGGRKLRYCSGACKAKDDRTLLRLGSTPIVLPAPLDALVSTLADGRRAPGTSLLDVPSSWLFPGRRPGSPLTEDALGQRLHALGISPRQSRNTALFTLAADVPAAILAKTLGIHIKAAIQWQKISGGDWAAYAADISRRSHAQERAPARRSARGPAARCLEVTFQTCCDLPIAADRHQMHTVEGSAVADGQDLLARRVHPGAAVTLNVIDQLAGDIDVRDSGRQIAGHARAGQHHHPRIDRYLQAGALTPPQQGIDRETDLHECEVGCSLPRRNRAQAGRDPDAKRPAAGERRIPVAPRASSIMARTVSSLVRPPTVGLSPDLGRVHGGAGRQPSEPACTVARRVEPGHRNRGHGRRQPGARRRPWPGRCVGQRVARLGLVPASGSGIRSSISANCRTISDSPRRISAKAPAVRPGNVLVSSTTYVQHSVSRRWYSAVPAAKRSRVASRGRRPGCGGANKARSGRLPTRPSARPARSGSRTVRPAGSIGGLRITTGCRRRISAGTLAGR